MSLNAKQLQQIPAFFEEHYLKPGKLPGLSVMVSQGSETVYRSDQQYNSDAIFRIYSMTKPVTSIALLQLYEQGLVRLGDPVSKYITSWRELRVWAGGSPSAYQTKGLDREPTVQDLLTHTAGLTYQWVNQHPVDALYREHGIVSIGEHGANLAAACDRLSNIPLLFQPGTRWSYSFATDVVGRLVEVISGKSLDAYIRDHILSPLGMSDTAFWVEEEASERLAVNYAQPRLTPFGLPAGADMEALMVEVDPTGPTSSYATKPLLFSGGGGLTSTLEDYHTFCRMLLAGGTLDGTRIVGRKTLEYATSNHLPGGADVQAMGQPMFGQSTFAGMGFGLGFSVTLSPADTRVISSPGMFSWGGAASTQFFVDPSEELIAIAMTQLMPSATYPIRDEFRQLVYAALD